ncbi:MAG: hypothetical protein KGH61_02700 [Candidatus Micrarchaeota archaeon]|nr:hypothetical protein [Candidatus Micrarchaeota archaeon]MDE1847834.1 hypothetical protein [Candidatus Micrarchaeota archaeon]MDE1864360.1 hypothetical protein [Candidatus Micrarchaeota archaeon]
MTKSALHIYVKKSSGKEYVYGQVNGVERYLYPKGGLQKLNKKNLMRLVEALNAKEGFELKENKKARNQLLSLFSGAKRPSTQ